MNYPSVSVVILNYNGRKNLGEHLLHSCLLSVLSSDYPDFEVIYVDNGSTDGSVEYVREKFAKDPKLSVLAYPENYGFARGNNLALKHTHGDYVIFLNNDVEVEKPWMRELTRVLESDESIGMAQCKILSFDKIHIQTAGNLLDPTLVTYFVGDNRKDQGRYDKICEITYACGAAFIARRAMIDKIGLFDPNYFFYHDDCDLGWRARLAGFKIVLVPTSVVYHKGQGTSASTFKKNQALYFLFTSRLGLLIKNLSMRNLFRFGCMMAIGIVMDSLGLLRGGDFKAPLKSAVWTARNFEHIWKSRLMVQLKIRKVNDDQVLKAFLDSSIFVLRLKRNLDRLASGKTRKDLSDLVNQVTDNYYKDHIVPYLELTSAR